MTKALIQRGCLAKGFCEAGWARQPRLERAELNRLGKDNCELKREKIF